MIPTRIKLTDYKCFSSETGGAEVELRPLTLFYGYNNSGKSALLRALSLVVEALSSGKPSTPIPLDSPLVKGADFESLVYGERSSFEVTATSKTGKDVTWKIRGFPDQYTHLVESFSVTVSGDRILNATLDLEKSKFGDGETVYKITRANAEEEFLDLRFTGLIPALATTDATNQIEKLLADVFDLRQSIRQPVIWLSSGRALNCRQRVVKSGPIIIDENGDGVEQLLFRSMNRGEEWALELQTWFENTFGVNVTAESTGKYISLMIGRRGSPHRVNLLDAGQGLQEVLPIIAALYWRASKQCDSILLSIEEPESHLHPRYHVNLAKALCEAANKSPDSVTLAETHSENLLLRVQIEVASKRIPHSSVVVYWVRQLEEGPSVIEPISFDELGRPVGNWPKGVFAEDVNQARELLAIQLKLESESSDQ